MVDMKINNCQIPLIGVIFLFLIAFSCPAWTSTHEDDAATIQKASQAFTRVAKAAIPTVVFIIQDLTEELSAKFGYENINGVLISNVQAGSPAALAGLRPGMLIIEVNRSSVSNVADFDKAFQASRESKKLLLLISDRQFVRYVSFPIQ